MTDKYKQAYLGLIVGVTAVSSAAIFVRLATAPSSVIAAYRLIFTVLILSIPTFLFHRKELKRVTLREWKYSFLSGVFLAFHFITWFESLKYTSVASSVVLVTLQPIFAMLGIYIIFKQKISLFGILGAVLALTGSFIIGWGDFKIGGMALYGDFLALIGAILVTGYWLVGQSLRRNLSLFPYTFIVYSSSSLVLILYNLLFRFEMLTYDKKNWINFFCSGNYPNNYGTYSI